MYTNEHALCKLVKGTPLSEPPDIFWYIVWQSISLYQYYWILLSSEPNHKDISNSIFGRTSCDAFMKQLSSKCAQAVRGTCDWPRRELEQSKKAVTLLDGWIINAIYSLEKTHFAWDKKHFLYTIIYSFTHYIFS